MPKTDILRPIVKSVDKIARLVIVDAKTISSMEVESRKVGTMRRLASRNSSGADMASSSRRPADRI